MHFALLTVAFLLQAVGSSHAATDDSAVRALVYMDISDAYFDKCIRLMNGTKQIGCQSSLSGNVGVLFHVNRSEDVTKITKAKHGPHIILIHVDYFNKSSVRLYKNLESVVGIIVYASERYAGKKDGWSPEPKCPRYIYSLYSKSHGSSYSNCENAWNEPGDALNEEDIDLPVFFMRNDTATNMMIKCHDDHNLDGEYPLCAAQMQARMSGAVSTETCLRRNQLQNNLSPAGYCDEIGGYTLLGTLQVTNSSHDTSKPIILITAAMDSRSFLLESSVPGANSATGFITLLAIVQALGNLTEEEKASMPYNIMFALFDGEAFDNMGSTRMVYDMSQGSFPFKNDGKAMQPAQFNLTNVKYIFEIGQVGHVNDKAFIHFDPLSADDPSVSINEITDALQNSTDDSLLFQNQSAGIGIIPSSLQSVLKQKNVSGVVITDFDKKYVNKHYFSLYDTPDKLGVVYNTSMTENEALLQLMPLAQKLANISRVVAKAAYKLGSMESKESPNVDVTEIAQTLYCYYFNDSCSMFLGLVDSSLKKLKVRNTTVKRYVTVYSNSGMKNSAYMARNLMFRYLGQFFSNFSDESDTKCASPDENDKTYTYLGFKRNGTVKCYRATVYSIDGRSPSAIIPEYDYTNGLYSAWSESKWNSDAFKMSIFLVQESVSQGMVLLSGLLVFLSSLVIIGIINHKSDILFNAGELL